MTSNFQGEPLPLPPEDELLRQLRDARAQIVALLHPGETEVRKGMNSFISSMGYDRAIILFFLKSRGVIANVRHPKYKDLWRVDPEVQFSRVWLKSQILNGRVPREYVPRSARGGQPSQLEEALEQLYAVTAERDQLAEQLAEIHRLSAPAQTDPDNQEAS